MREVGKGGTKTVYSSKTSYCIHHIHLLSASHLAVIQCICHVIHGTSSVQFGYILFSVL